MRIERVLSPNWTVEPSGTDIILNRADGVDSGYMLKGTAENLRDFLVEKYGPPSGYEKRVVTVRESLLSLGNRSVIRFKGDSNTFVKNSWGHWRNTVGDDYLAQKILDSAVEDNPYYVLFDSSKPLE